MKKLTAILVSVLFSLVPLFSVENTGGLPGYFLDLGVGARPLGLGGAFTAVSDDLSAVYWNPAGLTKLNKMEASLMHITLFEDTRYDSIGFAYPTRTRMVYGAAVMQEYTGGITERDINNAEGDELKDISTALYCSAGYFLNKDLSVGSGLKAVNKQFDDINKIWGALDLSALYSFTNFLDIGLNVRNCISTTFKRNDDTYYRVPIKVNLGFASKLLDILKGNKLLLSADAEYVEDAFLYRGGIELNYNNLAMLRGGYDNGDFTYGFGLAFRDYQLDYAIVDHTLGLSHRVSLAYKFGETVNRNTETVQEESVKTGTAEVKKSTEVVSGYNIFVNTMKEIPLSIYHLFEEKGISVINVKIINNTDKDMKLKFSYLIGIKDTPDYKDVIAPAGQTTDVNLVPMLKQEEVKKVEVVPSPSVIFLEIEQIDADGNTKSLLKKYYPATLLPYDQFFPKLIDTKEQEYDLLTTIANWITFNDRSMADVISKASEKGAVLNPPVKIVGFQSPNIFTKIPRDYRSIEEKEKDYMSQIKLIYDTLKEDYKLTYVNQPVTYQNSQRVKLPFDTLKNKGNCIELSVLFASLLESIEIEPIIAVFPKDGHIAAGWKVSSEGKDRYSLLETNLFGESFEKVLDKGSKTIEEYGMQTEFAQGIPFDENGIYKKDDNIILYDIKKLRAKIPPSPYIPR